MGHDVPEIFQKNPSTGKYEDPLREDMIVKNYPPKIGEYGYFDSRLMHNRNTFRNIEDVYQHCLIGTSPDSNRHPYGCHFSSPMDIKFERWITNHGIIHRVQMLQ